MKKKEHSVNIPTIEEVENEQKRLRHRAVYQRTLRGTIAVLLVVAAISVPCGNSVDAGSADLRFFHVTNFGSRADCSIGEDQSAEDRRSRCILAGE